MKARVLQRAAVLLLVVGLLAGLSSGAVPAGKKFSQQERATFKSSINQIVRKLVNNAIKKEQGIGWASVTAEGKTEESLNLYDGHPGIVYFLLKAYAATHDRAALEAARQGLTYILSQSKKDEQGLYFDPKNNGLFEGNAGPGYLFLYAWQVTKDKAYLKTAEDIARRIVAVPDVGDKSSPDIISGAAGTGLFLLKLYAVTKQPSYRSGAERLGDFLVAQAEPQSKGVKWKLYGDKQEYYFVGFSHGPAGIGYYLDRLYRVNKQEKYKEYADRAMAHIEDIAIREKGYVKWYHEELARQTRFSSQWCHGAPGMNPFFLELYARSKDPKYLDWAAINTRYLLDQGVNVRQNASVCHGITGNAASLWMMYEETGQDRYFDETRNSIKLLQETVKREPDGDYWPSLGHKVDYSYMTGLAGVGDFFVLLYSNGRLHMLEVLGYGDDR